MRKQIFLITFLFFLFALTVAKSYAAVIIGVTDVEKRIMRVTYLWTDDRAGATELKVGPFDFASTPIKIISAVEKNTGQELNAEIIQADGKQSILIKYPSPVPGGGHFKLDVTLEAQTEWISRDSNGRYAFTYKTGQETSFVLPKGHAVVFSNFPVLVYEKEGNTVLHVQELGAKELILGTRAFSDR